MSEHEWCRDVSRDEAVRAAEDAAAVPSIQHRDLPEQVALLWASVTDILGRVVRLEAEMDAGEDEEAAPAVCDPASPVEGLRTERVTLEIVYDAQFWHDPSTWAWSAVLKGRTKTVRVVEETRGERLPDMVAWITAERDAARAEAERLRDRVAELEAERAAGGVAQQEPLACGAIQSDCGTWMMSDKAGSVSVAREIAVHAMRAMRFDPDDFRKRDAVIAAIGPLLKRCLDSVAAPPEPRGWLTAEEREAVRRVRDHLVETSELTYRDIVTFNALLARSSPPRVKVPMVGSTFHWIAAIREAGGEVEG